MLIVVFSPIVVTAICIWANSSVPLFGWYSPNLCQACCTFVRLCHCCGNSKTKLWPEFDDVFWAQIMHKCLLTRPLSLFCDNPNL